MKVEKGIHLWFCSPILPLHLSLKAFQLDLDAHGVLLGICFHRRTFEAKTKLKQAVGLIFCATLWYAPDERDLTILLLSQGMWLIASGGWSFHLTELPLGGHFGPEKKNI